MQDGIGSEYSRNDRATEDSITIDGKAFKLDRSHLEYDRENLLAQRKIRTARGKFLTRACDLTYTPIHHQYDGLNLLVIAFNQDMTYGKFNGKCSIDGRILEIKDMWGLMETVSTRI